MASTFANSVRKLSDGQITLPSVDRGRMRATATICTPAIDREGEVIVPEGVEMDDYVLNPVVLWEHGFDSQITVPIARSVGPDGRLAVRLAKGVLEADAYFTNRVKESEQIFELVAEGIVRATSIHVIPTERREEYAGRQRITIYPTSSMLEWSWGRLGVNPEAVAKVLQLGRLAGSRIAPSLVKSLTPCAARASRSVVRVGADLRKAYKCACENPSKCSCKPVEKTMTPEEEDRLKKQQAESGEQSGEQTPPESEAPPEEGGDKTINEHDLPGESSAQAGTAGPTEEMPSVRVGKAVYSSLKNLMSNLEGAATTYEDPAAKEYFNGPFKQKCGEMMSEVKGLVSQLGGSTGDEEQPVDGQDPEAPAPAEEEAVKSFLASGKTHGLRLAGYVAPLESLAKARNLTSAQRLQLEGVLKNVRTVIGSAQSEARKQQAAATEQQVVAVKEQFASLSKSLAELKSSLGSLG